MFYCSRCGISFVPKQITTRKKSEDYFDAYSLKKYISYYKAFRLKIFSENWKVISRFIHGGKAIDVGASFGWFIECAPKSWKVMGVDQSKNAAAYARSQGLRVYTGTERKLMRKPSHFDLITLHNALEHLSHPLQSLRILHKALKKDGMVVIAVPNKNGLINRCAYALALIHMYRPIFTLFQVESTSPHLFYYSPQSITHMLNLAGFTPLVIRGQPIIDIDNIDKCMAIEGKTNILSRLFIKAGLTILYHASVLLNMPDEIVIYASKTES